MKLKQKLPWWPIPKTILAFVFVMMAVGAFIASISALQADYFLWSKTNRFLHDALWIPGSLLAGASSAIAIMIWPRQGIFQVSSTGKMRSKAAMRQLGIIVTLAFIGHLLGFAPLLYFTSRYGSGGSASWASLLVAFSGVITLVAIGFFTGLAIKRIYIAPLISVATFALMAIISEPMLRPLALLFPVHQVAGSARFETNPAVAVFSLIFACTLLLAGYSVLSFPLAGKNPGLSANCRNLLLPQIVPAVCVLALVGCAFVWRPELLTVHRPVKTSCFKIQELQVCLHEQNLPARPSIQKSITRLQKVGINSLLTTISDDAAVERDLPRNSEAFIIVDSGPYDSENVANSLEESIAWQVVSAATTDRCIDKTKTIESHDLNSAIAHELLQRAKYPNLAEHISPEVNSTFAHMSERELNSFLHTQNRLVTSCSLENKTL